MRLSLFAAALVLAAAAAAPLASGCESGPLTGWCTHPGAVYSLVDCDGDGRKDHACFDDQGQGGVLLGSSDPGSCTSLSGQQWPAAKPIHCPAARLPGACSVGPASSGWCIHSGSVYTNKDCNGDGWPDHACFDDQGQGGVILSTPTGCMTPSGQAWPHARLSNCPAASKPGQPSCGSGTWSATARKCACPPSTFWDATARSCARSLAATVVILRVCDQAHGGGYTQSISEQQVEAALFTGSGQTLKSYFSDLSFGKITLRPAGAAITTVTLPCVANGKDLSVGPCDTDGWVGHVENNPGSVLSADVLATWDAKRPHLFVGPNRCNTGWSSGHTIYLPPGSDSGVAPWNLIAGDLIHEYGHQLGLGHSGLASTDSWAQVYGDTSTPMGNGGGKNRTTGYWPSFAGPHMAQLGWSSLVGRLDTNSLPLGQWKHFNLPALVDASRSLLRLDGDWLSPAVPVYLSLRVARGEDRDLSVTSNPAGYFDRAVSVHSIPPDGDGTTKMLAALKPSNSATFTDLKVVVAHRQQLGSVGVCRYAGSDAAACAQG